MLQGNACITTVWQNFLTLWTYSELREILEEGTFTMLYATKFRHIRERQRVRESKGENESKRARASESTSARESESKRDIVRFLDKRRG